jgi:hypothetical protein
VKCQDASSSAPTGDLTDGPCRTTTGWSRTGRPGEGTIVLTVTGLDRGGLEALWRGGRDASGDAVEPFVDVDGGWPLRCCLTDSVPGERVAVVAWSPYPWRGPYAETGPVVVHAEPCAGPVGSGVPPQFLTRPQRLRPYGRDRRIAYDRIRLVDGDGSLPDVLVELLADDEVDFVQARNVAAGCYSFTVRRG